MNQDKKEEEEVNFWFISHSSLQAAALWCHGWRSSIPDQIFQLLAKLKIKWDQGISRAKLYGRFHVAIHSAPLFFLHSAGYNWGIPRSSGPKFAGRPAGNTTATKGDTQDQRRKRMAVSSSGQPVDGHWMWWTRSTRSDARVAAIKVSIVYRMTYHALLTRLFFVFFRDGYYRKRLPTRTVSPLLLLADGLLAGLVITGSFLIAPWTETSSSSSFIRSSLYVSAVEFIIKIPLQRPRLLSAIGFMDFASSFLILLPAAWLRVWSPDWRTAASAVQPSAESLAWFFRRSNAWAAAAPIRIHVNDDVRCDVTTTTSRHNTQVLPLVKKILSSASLVYWLLPPHLNSSALTDLVVPHSSSYIPGYAGGCTRTLSHSAPYETHLRATSFFFLFPYPTIFLVCFCFPRNSYGWFLHFFSLSLSFISKFTSTK